MKQAKVLIDLNYLINRSHHGVSSGLTCAIPWRTDQPEICTNSLVGSVHFVIWLQKHLATRGYSVRFQDMVACDDVGMSFRRILFEGYKANRTSKDPERLAARRDMLHCKAIARNVLMVLGVHTAKSELFDFQGTLAAYEADDVIATHIFDDWDAVSAGAEATRFFIYSTDMDLSQLVTDRVTLLRSMPEGLVELDSSNIHTAISQKTKEKIRYWGVTHPLEVLLYKAIVGDSSDNYPGVKGCGPAIWDHVLRRFREKSAAAPGGMYADFLLDHAAYVHLFPPAQQARFASYWDDFKLSWNLAALQRCPKIIMDEVSPVSCADDRELTFSCQDGWDGMRKVLHSYRCRDLIEYVDAALGHAQAPVFADPFESSILWGES